MILGGSDVLRQHTPARFGDRDVLSIEWLGMGEHDRASLVWVAEAIEVIGDWVGRGHARLTPCDEREPVPAASILNPTGRFTIDDCDKSHRPMSQRYCARFA